MEGTPANERHSFVKAHQKLVVAYRSDVYPQPRVRVLLFRRTSRLYGPVLPVLSIPLSCMEFREVIDGSNVQGRSPTPTEAIVL